MVELVCLPLSFWCWLPWVSELCLMSLPGAIFSWVYGCPDFPLEKSAGIGLEPSLVSMLSLVWYIW